MPNHLVWKVKKKFSHFRCLSNLNKLTKDLVLCLKIILISYFCNISIWHLKSYTQSKKNVYYSINVHLENNILKTGIWKTPTCAFSKKLLWEARWSALGDWMWKIELLELNYLGLLESTYYPAVDTEKKSPT